MLPVTQETFSHIRNILTPFGDETEIVRDEDLRVLGGRQPWSAVVRKRQDRGALRRAKKRGSESGPRVTRSDTSISERRDLQAHAGPDGDTPMGFQPVRTDQKPFVFDPAVDP